MQAPETPSEGEATRDPPSVGRAERWVRRIDRFQQTHPLVGFPFAVMQKFGNDQAGAMATRVAYHGLFSLFPVLLLFTTILGFILPGNPGLRSALVRSALGNFPVIGAQLRSDVHPLTGSAAALAVGLGGSLYGTFGLAQSAQTAVNTVWNIPYVEWPSFVARRLRGMALLLLLGVATLGSAALSTFAGLASGIGPSIGAYAAAIVINLGVFFGAFQLLTAERLRWREVALGAVLAAVFWQVLQAVGSWYMARELTNASGTYGFFAVTIALLSWMFLGAQLVLLALEINVVQRYGLWPRSMVQPPLTVGDKRTFDRLARMAVRRPEYDVSVRFNPSADRTPPGSTPAPDGPAPNGDRPQAADTGTPGERGGAGTPVERGGAGTPVERGGGRSRRFPRGGPG